MSWLVSLATRWAYFGIYKGFIIRIHHSTDCMDASEEIGQ
jgi:hypothetical protein